MAGAFSSVNLFSDGRFSAWRAVAHESGRCNVEEGPPQKKLRRAEAEEAKTRKKRKKKKKKKKRKENCAG